MLRPAIAALALLSLASAAEARAKCDGIHRCTCGSTQTRHFNLPRNFNGHNLWRAVEWTRAFPHTTAHPGAVMYQHGGGPSGHVSRIVSVTGPCTAIVADEKGQYERNTCKRGAVFVDPNGNAATLSNRAQGSGRTGVRHSNQAPDWGRGRVDYPNFGA